MKNKKILLIVILFLFLSILISATKAIYREKLSTNIRLSITSSKYNVVFNGNGSTSGTTATKECKYNEDCKLTKNGFEKVGYDFIGWATSENGEKVYDDEQEVQNLTVSGEYVLYAKWNPKELTFNNQTINKEYNESTNQTFNLTEATGGTGSYTYTKTSEKDSSNTDTNYISISGTTITILADAPASTYTFVITATDNNSGATKDATYTIVVEKQRIELPTCGSFTYNKGEQTLINSTTEYTATNNKGINAGDYIVKLTPTSNYQWSDDTTGEKNVTCVIEQYDITSTATVVPVTNKTYNGSSFTPTPAVTVPLPSSITTYTLTSSEVEYSYVNNTNAGVATITISGVGNYKGSKTLEFTIEKAEGYVNVENITQNINYGTTSIANRVTTSHGGEIEVTTTKGTANISGDTITISGLGTTSSGTEITVTVKSKATDNYTEGSTTYKINVTNASLTGGSVTLSGKNTLGSTLTASVTDTTPQGIYTYEWYRNTTNSTSGGEKISEATGNTYEITTSDIGSYIYVVVTATKANYDSTSFSDITDNTNNVTAVSKNTVVKPTAATYCKSLTYNGNSQVLTNTAATGYAFYENSGIDAGPYTVTAKVINNYIWSDDTTEDVKIRCTIAKKDITLTAESGTKVYDGTALTNSTCTSSGLISGDTATCVMTNESTITNAGSVDNEISTYVISNNTKDVTSNYNVTTEKGILTVTKATPTVSLTAKTGMSWNNTAQVANPASITLVNNETYTGDITYTYYTNSECTTGATTTAPTLAGNYYVKAITDAFGNYNEGASSCVEHTISLLTPMVTLTPKTAEYTGSFIEANTATISTPNGGGEVTYTYYEDSSCSVVYEKQGNKLSGTLVWVDYDNEYRTRPDAVTISLYENGSIINTAPVWIESNESNWTFTYSGLNLSNNYEVDIAPIEYYECSTSGLTITCRLIQSDQPAYTDLSGSITWVDNDNALGLRPSAVTIRLLQDGVEIGSRTATAATGWSYTFENQPVDNGYGGTYTYEIRVDGIPRYLIRTDGLNIIAKYLIDPPTPPGGDDPPTPPSPGDTPTSTNPILSSSSLMSFSSKLLRTNSTQSSQNEAPSDVGTYYVKASVAAVNGKTTSAESACVPHVINKATVSPVTNLSISTSGIISWTNSSNADGYEISIDGTNWTTVVPGTTTTSYNYLSSITGSTGTRTVYVKATNSDTTNYTASTTNTTVTVYTLTVDSNNADYGTVSPSSINVISGATYTTSGNTLTLSDGRSVTATPTKLSGYNTTLDSWSSTSGTINSNMSVTANFIREQAIYNITFDANTGTFSDSSTTNNVIYTMESSSITKYSHTSNIDDTGVASSVYANNLSVNDVVTIDGAESIDIEVWYSTESARYDWLAIYQKGVTPASGNYSSATISNGKLAGHGSYTGYTKPEDSDTTYHKTYTVNSDTAQFYFKSDSSTGYYGYYAIISGTGNVLVNDSGTYKEPTKDGKVFNGWNTESDGSGTTYKDEASLVNLTDATITLYAQYRNPTATFTTGQLFNQAIKVASGQSSATYSTSNSTITAFTKFTGEFTETLRNNAVKVSSDDSESDIYAWFDNDTIYWYTTSDTVYFNPDSSYMFNYLTAIDTIDLSEFDLSKVSSSSSIFSSTTNLTTIITPKVNSSTSISIGKTMMNSSNTTYSSITSTTPTMTTLKVPYTITFDKNGGVSSSCTSTSLTKQIYPGNALGTTPNATFTKVGYTIGGWQTEANGGSQVTSSTIPPSSITYYARWLKSGLFAEDIKNNNTYAGVNCESIQCMIEYFAQFKEKRVDINGN